MGVYIWSRLPSEYQEVEWIGGNNGNSSSPIVYINTGVASSNNIGCHTEMLHTGTRDNLRFFDNDLPSTTNRWGLVAYPSGNWCPQWGTRIQTNVSYNINQFYDIKLNRNNNKLCTIDGTTIYNCSSTSFMGPSIKIGQITYSGNYGWKLKYFKITDGTTLIRDFVPCYRKSDNVIGLYDLVNNQFYTNSGSGTFTKGSDVDTYRESLLKNAYIGEVYEYSYDFRNKSSTILTNDGWTLSNSSNTAFNSEGIYSNTNQVLTATHSIPSLTNAKKVTFSMVVSITMSSASGASYRSYTDNISTKRFGILNNKDNNSNPAQAGYQITSGGVFSQNISSGTYTEKLVYDLENKTVSFTVNGTTYTGTMTDTDVTNLKTNNGFYLYYGQTQATTAQAKITSIGFTVE